MLVNDPERWRASMQAALQVFDVKLSGGAATGESGEAEERTGGEGSADPTGAAVDALNSFNVSVGLRWHAEVKRSSTAASLQSAAEMAPSVTNVKKLSRNIGTLQNILPGILKKANLEDANQLLEKTGW